MKSINEKKRVILKTLRTNFDVLLTVHFTYRCDDTRGCVMQFLPPDDEHMCSKHVDA